MQKILILISSLFFSNLIGHELKLNIIPTPQIITFKNSNSKLFNLENLSLMLDESSKNKFERSIILLKRDLNNFIKDKNGEKILVKFEIIENLEDYQIPEEHKNEAYVLEINDESILISSLNEKGIFLGVQSLIQIFENHKTLSPCKIIDWPDMKIRGISDDISRGQVSTLDNFKRIIRFISKYKMNTYMPYLEDMIEFKSYPSIGKNRGALTVEEITEIVKYADEHFVEVIPIFQTLGHFENILSQKEFIDYADFPGAASLDVTQEKTYEFIETMLKEVFELFPSKYFHMGADESYDVGLGRSKKLLENSDLATIHANHYKRVYDICKSYGKEVIMYGDILLKHSEILDQIPNDIIIVDWQYYPKFEYPSTKTFSEAGFKYISSPTVWNFNASFPENFLAIPNIETFTRDGIVNNSIGMINSSWGDYGAEGFRELNLYGYAWSAQCSWNISQSNSGDFSESFFYNFYGTDDKNISIIYSELSDPINQVLWNELWRHPLFPHRKHDWRTQKFPTASKLFAMRNSKLDIEFSEINSSISKNKGHLDLLKFSWEFRNYFLLKIETQELLHKKFNQTKIDEDRLSNLINKNISDLERLKKEFRTLWLQYNKEANLWMIEDKFDRLTQYFIEISDQLKIDSLENPEIESSCIYYSDGSDSLTSRAIFKTTFNFESKIEKAFLQFLADGHAKLFINGNFIDEVYVKRSGSLWIEQQRVKLIDIREYLREGENEIKLEAHCYRYRNACVNVTAEISSSDDTFKLKSDSSWLVSKDDGETWIKASIEEIKKPLIIAPNFERLRKSWIER